MSQKCVKANFHKDNHVLSYLARSSCVQSRHSYNVEKQILASGARDSLLSRVTFICVHHREYLVWLIGPRGAEYVGIICMYRQANV